MVAHHIVQPVMLLKKRALRIHINESGTIRAFQPVFNTPMQSGTGIRKTHLKGSAVEQHQPAEKNAMHMEIETKEEPEDGLNEHIFEKMRWADLVKIRALAKAKSKALPKGGASWM